jgi:hypothetical protein
MMLTLRAPRIPTRPRAGNSGRQLLLRRLPSNCSRRVVVAPTRTQLLMAGAGTTVAAPAVTYMLPPRRRLAVVANG